MALELASVSDWFMSRRMVMRQFEALMVNSSGFLSLVNAFLVLAFLEPLCRGRCRQVPSPCENVTVR